MKNKISGLLKSITIIFDHIIFATKTSRKRLLSFFIIIFATYINRCGVLKSVLLYGRSRAKGLFFNARYHRLGHIHQYLTSCRWPSAIR